MEHNSGKRKRPTNGETNGNDADIYGKAAAIGTVRLAAASSPSIERLRELVEAAAKAVELLQTLGRATKASDHADRLAEALRQQS